MTQLVTTPTLTLVAFSTRRSREWTGSGVGISASPTTEGAQQGTSERWENAEMPRYAVFAALTRFRAGLAGASPKVASRIKLSMDSTKSAVHAQYKRFRAVACQGPTVLASRELRAAQPLTEWKPVTLNGIPENTCFLELPAGEALHSQSIPRSGEAPHDVL